MPKIDHAQCFQIGVKGYASSHTKYDTELSYLVSRGTPQSIQFTQAAQSTTTAVRITYKRSLSQLTKPILAHTAVLIFFLSAIFPLRDLSC